MGVVAEGETPSLTGELIRETHRVLECYILRGGDLGIGRAGNDPCHCIVALYVGGRSEKENPPGCLIAIKSSLFFMNTLSWKDKSNTEQFFY